MTIFSSLTNRIFLASALLTVSDALEADKRAVTDRFDRVLSWSAIATRTVDEYTSVLNDKRAAR